MMSLSRMTCLVAFLAVVDSELESQPVGMSMSSWHGVEQNEHDCKTAHSF